MSWALHGAGRLQACWASIVCRLEKENPARRAMRTGIYQARPGRGAVTMYCFLHHKRSQRSRDGVRARWLPTRPHLDSDQCVVKEVRTTCGGISLDELTRGMSRSKHSTVRGSTQCDEVNIPRS